MDIGKTVEKIYKYLEDDLVESAVMACLRVARHNKDFMNGAIFLRELYPNKFEVARSLWDEISPLKEETQKFIFELSLERWLELHSIESMTPDEDREKPKGAQRNLLAVAVGDIENEISQSESCITDLTLPLGMGEFDTAAFTDRLMPQKAAFRLRIKALHTLKSRIKTRCLSYAIQIERQFTRQVKTQGFLENVQNDVNNFFKARSDDVFIKLQKATQLAASEELEDCSLVLAEVRRAMKASADYFYPPVMERMRGADGKERLLTDERYLNRLHQFLAERVAKSASKELLEGELNHLIAFMDRLNDMASKGVHGAVTLAEARQGLIGLYFFLFNLSQHLITEAHSYRQN